MESVDDEIPEEIHKRMELFDKSLSDVEDVLKPFLKIPIADVRDKVADPLQNAKLDLMVAYTTNSLFWTYLVTQGIDPKEHPIKDEMLRIKKYMARAQELQDKKKMAKIDTNAAKRFVRNALWKLPEKSNDVEQSVELDQQETEREKKKRKRNAGNDKKNTEQKKKKKKKKKLKDD